MVYLLLKYPNESHLTGYLITLASTFLGAILGGTIAYLTNVALKKREIKANAYASAVLIRSRLIEQTSELENFKKRLEERQEIMPTLDIQKARLNPTGENYSNFIVVMQTNDVEEKKALYDINFNLIENLSLWREKFSNFEIILQALSEALNIAEELNSLKEKFIDIKKQFSQSENIHKKTSEEEFEQFLEKMQQHLIILTHSIPQNIEYTAQLITRMKKIFAVFQKKICEPLGIKVIEIKKIAPLEDILDGLINKT